MAKQARVTIETTALDGLTLLAQGALASEDAKTFLAAMPTVGTLMPVLDVAGLGPLALQGPRTTDDDDSTSDA
jgi:hypothetical protein